MNGENLLIHDLLRRADRIYGIPGYPVTRLVSGTKAISVINEKVALEYALGDSLTGRRAAVIVKHVGLNTLSDPMVNATYQGLIGGVVIIGGDDPSVVSSTVVENSAAYGSVAAIPVIAWKPDNIDVIHTALKASERFSRVALVTVQPHDLAEETSIQRDETHHTISASGHEQGRLTDTDCTMYGRCVTAAAMNQSIADCGMMPPGSQYPKPIGERKKQSRKARGYNMTLCATCPFRPLYDILEKQGDRVICDTGCSLIAMNPPYHFGYASYGMGSAIAVAATSTGIALIGDYGLLHSGLLALIDVYEKNLPLLCIIMQNRCMGMTGGQPVCDLMPYIRFADPLVISADDSAALSEVLTTTRRPCTVVVQGDCPEVIHHETYAY